MKFSTSQSKISSSYGHNEKNVFPNDKFPSRNLNLSLQTVLPLILKKETKHQQIKTLETSKKRSQQVEDSEEKMCKPFREMPNESKSHEKSNRKTYFNMCSHPVSIWMLLVELKE